MNLSVDLGIHSNFGHFGPTNVSRMEQEWLYNMDIYMDCRGSFWRLVRLKNFFKPEFLNRLDEVGGCRKDGMLRNHR